eukprot:31265-Pelagococcus_subviridis.AAC.10
MLTEIDSLQNLKLPALHVKAEQVHVDPPAQRFTLVQDVAQRPTLDRRSRRVAGPELRVIFFLKRLHHELFDPVHRWNARVLDELIDVVRRAHRGVERLVSRPVRLQQLETPRGQLY